MCGSRPTQKTPNLFFFRGAATGVVFAISLSLASFLFFSFLPAKQVKNTTHIPRKSKMKVATSSQIAPPKCAVAELSSSLTWCLTIPNRVKSVAMTITVKSKAIEAARALASDPVTPPPMLSRKAMNATPQAIGCRTITRVSASEVPPLMSS